MKQEHRKAVAGFKLSMLDQLKAGEFHPSVNVYMVLWLIGQIEELDQRQIEGSKGDNMEDKTYKITLENHSEKFIKAQFYRRSDNDSLDLFADTEEGERITVGSFAAGQWRYIEMVTGESVCDGTEAIINEAIAKIIEMQDVAIRRILDRHNTELESREMNISFSDPEKYAVLTEPRIGFWSEQGNK